MKKREIWLDALRLLAAFLVIVNHTNSDVFRSVTPANGTWWFSILWYAVSKTAVPLFVMVSGACLLGRQDSFRKCLGRFVRIVIVLIVFSFLYYAFECWQSHVRLNPAQLGMRIWKQEITDSFWYLYFYAGLMLMLPMLQRLSCAMRGRDGLYLTGMCLGFGALAPLLAHLNPALALPGYLDVPLFSTYIGLFFAGWLIRRSPLPGKAGRFGWLLLGVGAIAASVYLLRENYAEGTKYWRFMDDRMQPGFLIVIAAIAAAILFKFFFSRCSGTAASLLSTFGSCAFGIYLLQDWLIEQTQLSIFVPLCNAMPAFPAVVLWEILLFLAALAATWVVRLIPGVKKLI